MKGDIWYLKDSNGYIVAMFEQTDNYMTGVCKNCFSWASDKQPCEWHFFANIYCKPDSCTHWYFYGEDFTDEESIDGYYHVCGAFGFCEYIRTMCFIWKIAPDIIKELYDDPYSYCPNYYTESPLLNDTVDRMLEGYTIERVRKGDGDEH